MNSNDCLQATFESREQYKISPVDHIRLHESVGEFKVLINKSLPFLLYVLLIRDLSGKQNF